MILEEDEFNLIQEALKHAKSESRWTLEDLLTSEEGFGLTTATPLQRAICRVVDGVPLGDLKNHPHVVAYMGDTTPIDGKRPSEFSVFSGIRTGKSLFAACLAVYATQTCDLSLLGPGETPRVSVLSVSKDLAQVIFGHILGNLAAKPELQGLVASEPTTDSVLLYHPTGRPVEIKVVAGSKAGASLVARWSAGCLFDEAPRMVGAEEGVVNWDDAHNSVKGRLLPGAQIGSIGSPWAPKGPAWNIVKKNWLKPSLDMICVKTPANTMNPVWWTEERMEKLRLTDPDVYRTDVMAEFLEPEEAFFSSIEIDKSTRESPIHREPEAGVSYVAAMDPATRSNDWTLVIAGKMRDGRKSIVYNERWQGSKAEPLSPSEVIAKIAEVCRKYDVGVVYSDQYYGDALRDIAMNHRIYVNVEEWTSKRKIESYTNVKREIATGMVELPPDPYIRSDMLAAKRVIRQNGISVQLPHTQDGRHADYAPAVVMAIARFLIDPEDQKPELGTIERLRWEAAETERQEEEDLLYGGMEWD